MSFVRKLICGKRIDNSSESSSKDDLEEIFQLGCKYKDSYKNQEALKCFTIAADLGHVRSQYEVGFIYSNGIGVSCDYSKAIKYFELAKEQKYTGAYGSLAYLYLEGLGVERDFKKAFLYLKSAAEIGDIGAMCNLASLYFNDQIDYPESDINEGLKWLVKAAENNNHQASFDAQFKLGCLYYGYSQGGLLKGPYFEARKWFLLAAGNGHSEALNILREHYKL